MKRLSASLLVFNMFVVMVTLAPCKSYCYFLFIAELPCKQIAQLEGDLLDVYFCDLFQNRDIVHFRNALFFCQTANICDISRARALYIK